MTTPTPCPGRCNNAWRKAEQALTDKGTAHDLTPNWGDPAQCWGCVDRARHQLTALPELLTAVHLEALYGTPPPTGSTTHAVAAAPWPGQASRMLLDTVLSEMEELKADVLKLRGIWRADYQPRPGGNEGRRISSAVAHLDAHLDWAMQHHPAAAEPHDRGNANPAAQIGWWYHAAQRFTRRDAGHVQLSAPCPRCSLRTLSRSDGDTYIACRNPECELLLSDVEYAEHAQETADTALIGQAA